METVGEESKQKLHFRKFIVVERTYEGTGLAHPDMLHKVELPHIYEFFNNHDVLSMIFRSISKISSSPVIVFGSVKNTIIRNHFPVEIGHYVDDETHLERVDLSRYSDLDLLVILTEEEQSALRVELENQLENNNVYEVVSAAASAGKRFQRIEIASDSPSDKISIFSTLQEKPYGNLTDEEVDHTIIESFKRMNLNIDTVVLILDQTDQKAILYDKFDRVIHNTGDSDYYFKLAIAGTDSILESAFDNGITINIETIPDKHKNIIDAVNEMDLDKIKMLYNENPMEFMLVMEIPFRIIKYIPFGFTFNDPDTQYKLMNLAVNIPNLKGIVSDEHLTKLFKEGSFALSRYIGNARIVNQEADFPLISYSELVTCMPVLHAFIPQFTDRAFGAVRNMPVNFWPFNPDKWIDKADYSEDERQMHLKNYLIFDYLSAQEIPKAEPKGINNVVAMAAFSTISAKILQNEVLDIEGEFDLIQNELKNNHFQHVENVNDFDIDTTINICRNAVNKFLAKSPPKGEINETKIQALFSEGYFEELF